MGYITEALMAISNNTAPLAKEGQVMSRRFVELVGWVTPDERTGDEIAADIIRRAELRTQDECI